MGIRTRALVAAVSVMASLPGSAAAESRLVQCGAAGFGDTVFEGARAAGQAAGRRGERSLPERDGEGHLIPRPYIIDLDPIFPDGLELFGQRHRLLFVNLFGHVSLDRVEDRYIFDLGHPDPLPENALPKPIFAPFDAQVNTHLCGTDDPGPINTVYWCGGRGRLVVTWLEMLPDADGGCDAVAELRRRGEAISFQLIIEALYSPGNAMPRPGDYAVEFRYDRCDWMPRTPTVRGRAHRGWAAIRFPNLPPVARLGLVARDETGDLVDPRRAEAVDGLDDLCVGSNVVPAQPGVFRFEFVDGVPRGWPDAVGWPSDETDLDLDGVVDELDNCPLYANLGQRDLDGDGEGDVCEDDIDGDGISDRDDNCAHHPNPDQENMAGDFVPADPRAWCPDAGRFLPPPNDEGDACDPDIDGDGLANHEDLCPTHWSRGPEADPFLFNVDLDGDDLGDACDPDRDGDGVFNSIRACNGSVWNPSEPDNCRDQANPTQSDIDGDGMGDVCDEDRDNDGIADCDPTRPPRFCIWSSDGRTRTLGHGDNCVEVENPSQADEDGDGIGDACERHPPGPAHVGSSDRARETIRARVEHMRRVLRGREGGR